jgi:A1 cistron-splicing factor AAR2
MQCIMPQSGYISSVAAFQSESSSSKERLQALAERQEASAGGGTAPPPELPEMDVVPGTAVRFTAIPRQKYPDGATPAEITKYSMDHSYVLRTLLDNSYREITDILGELQIAFICFLIGQNLEAFEQWKQLVHLFCSSDELLDTESGLFSQFISTLHYHIQDIPEDFFVDIVSRNNFLTVTLQEFFSNLEASSASVQLKSKGARFCEHLQNKFKWDFITEPDDYAPVIVEDC